MYNDVSLDVALLPVDQISLKSKHNPQLGEIACRSARCRRHLTSTTTIPFEVYCAFNNMRTLKFKARQTNNNDDDDDDDSEILLLI